MTKLTKLIGTAVIAASAIAFAPAQAGVIDFAEEARVNGERGFVSGTAIEIGGEQLVLLAFGNPYLDGPSNGKPGGLGVCQNLATQNGIANQCAPNSDDSIQQATLPGLTFAEEIGIAFDGKHNVRDLSFNDYAHNEINTSNDGYVTFRNGNGFVGEFLFSDLIALAVAGDAIFQNTSFVSFAFVDLGFYVNAVTISDIPIPGALPLLLSGLAGLGFASRKKKKLSA